MNQRTPFNTTINGNHASGYRSFAEIGDHDNHILIHVSSTSRENSMPWRQYMHDLDDFFSRLYKYHQKSGFTCLVFSQLLELAQIVYSVFLPIFFLNYVDYDILFRNKPPNSANPTAKVHIYDVVKPYNTVTIPSIQLFAIFLATIFLIWKTIKTIHSFNINLAIKQFYKDVLHINDCSSLAWQDVQARIISSKHNFLAQDSHLTELDIHNRILRHSNYMIALINRGVLPIYYKVPFLGETTFFTQSFLYNCQLLFFRGPFKCIFEKNWLINDDVKTSTCRQVVARKFERNIVILAIINFLLFPILFIWQILYFFYSNAALVKRDPVVLGLRNWSLYARWFCRHFNELDHQLNDRLNHAYKPAKNYMDAFTSPLLEILARHVRFVAGSTFAVLLLLTIYDEDVIQVVHLLTLVTLLWVTWSSASGFIPPDIPLRFTKSELYEQILQNIHYVPQDYPPFTPQARLAMSNLFQYKIIKLLEDLLSTLATPYIMIRHLKPRSLEIVDFFRSYTIEIPATGDVCVFSMMNIKENGNPQWQPMMTSMQKSVDRQSEMSGGDNSLSKNNQDPHHKPRSRERTTNMTTSASSNNQTTTDSRHGGDLLAMTTQQQQQPQQKRNDNYQSMTSSTSYHDGAATFSGSPQREQMHQFERDTLLNPAMPLQTEHGKLELSLINFKAQNPSWNPANDMQKEFIQQVTSQAIGQAASRQLSHLSGDLQDLSHHPMQPQPLSQLHQQQQNLSTGSGTGSFARPRSPQRIIDVDSSTAISLSTLFLHEHARMPMSTNNFPSTSSSIRNQHQQFQQPAQHQQSSTRADRNPSNENDPLL